MCNKLKQRWKVNDLNLVLILCTFTFAGSLCGYLGKKILSVSGLEKSVAWIPACLIVFMLLWPLCVLALSILFGQFNFFKSYLLKIWKRIRKGKKPVVSIAIFASGAGSNAQRVINHFKRSPHVHITLIVCNKPGAGVLSIAAKENIPFLLIERKRFFEDDGYIPELKKHSIDFIVLAGFLWKIPPLLLQAYPGKIINIHPALLPKYGGKGMYGGKVHEAVIAAKEKESGISIHYVDEIYDHGAIIFQASCPVEEQDTPESLAQKIHSLEHRYYPLVIEELLQTLKQK